MAIYIVLGSFTDQGIRDVKQSPKRQAAAKELVKKLGGEVKQIYMTMGVYDYVVVVELPDDAAAAKFALTTASLGNVRSTTLKAFSEHEFLEIAASLP